MDKEVQHGMLGDGKEVGSGQKRMTKEEGKAGH